MDLTWYGHGCFRLRGKRAAVVTDPPSTAPGQRTPRLEADLVTLSHPSPGRSVAVDGPDGAYRIVGPGEYEVQEVTVLGLDSRQAAAPGGEAAHNTIYVIDLDEVRVCHLGDLGKVPDERLLERIGDVDVLLVPVGGGPALSATHAAEAVRRLEPRFVVPMQYAQPPLDGELEPLEPFLREMGLETAEPVNRLSVQSSASGDSELRVVVLERRS